MPKLKTHKTTAKRIRQTASGKLQRSTVSNQHLRHNKSRRQLQAAKRYAFLTKGTSKHLKKLLPYL